MRKRPAIALMITIFFIMLISVAMGVGLKQLNDSKKEVESENFMLQTSFILDDISKLLREMPILKKVADSNDSEAYFLFLSSASIIPLESSGVSILIELTSARAKFNINSMVDSNRTINEQRVDALGVYINSYAINAEYINLLLDNMLKVKEDMSYNTDIFTHEPYLFRDYISSQKHLEVINNFYMKSYNDKAIERLEYKNLFYYSNRHDYKIDVNYATVATWQLLLGCDELRAQEMSLNAGAYKELADLNLGPNEKINFERFQVSYFEPILDVKIEIMKKDEVSKIEFEYDMKTGKGSNFVYEI